MNNSFAGAILVIFATISFSLTSVFLKLAINEGYNGVFIIGAAVLIAAIVYWIFILLKREKIKVFSLVLMEYILVTISTYFFQIKALEKISTSLFTCIFFAYPVFVIILGKFYLKETISKRKTIALIAAIIGLILSAGILGSKVSFNSLGVLFAFISCISYAAYCVLLQKLLLKVKSTVAIAYMFTFTALFSFIYTFASGNLQSKLTFREILLILVIALTSHIFPIIAIATGVKNMGASAVSIISLFEPVLTLVIARLVFGDIITTAQIIGFLIVTFSIILITFDNNLGNLKKNVLDYEV